MRIFSKFTSIRFRNMLNSIIKFGAMYTPEELTEAQLQVDYDELKKLTDRFVDTKNKYDSKVTEYDELKKDIDIHIEAAKRFRDKRDAVTDNASLKIEYNNKMTLLVNKAETYTKRSELMEKEIDLLKQNMDLLNQAVDKLIHDIETRKIKALEAKNRIENAKLKKQMITELENTVKLTSGIISDNSKINTAIDAMNKVADEIENDIESTKIRTDRLSSKTETDKDINDTLNDVRGMTAIKDKTVDERLNNLLKK